MSVNPARVTHLRIDEGKTFRWNLQWLVNGTPQDLTGAAVKLCIAANTSSTALFDITGTLVNATNGDVQFEISEALTAANLSSLAKATRYEFDVEVQDAGGDHYVIALGSIMLYPRNCV